MRKLAPLAVLVLVAGVLSITLVGASIAAEETTLTFVYVPQTETGIDVDGDHELTPGDGWVSSAELKKAGVVEGKVAQSCQYITVRSDGMGGNLQCVTTAKLPEGQITTQLRFRLVEGETTGSVAAVTGGTGAFATASGYVESQAIPGTSNATITFHLYP